MILRCRTRNTNTIVFGSGLPTAFRAHPGLVHLVWHTSSVHNCLTKMNLHNIQPSYSGDSQSGFPCIQSRLKHFCLKETISYRAETCKFWLAHCNSPFWTDSFYWQQAFKLNMWLVQVTTHWSMGVATSQLLWRHLCQKMWWTRFWTVQVSSPNKDCSVVPTFICFYVFHPKGTLRIGQ